MTDKDDWKAKARRARLAGVSYAEIGRQLRKHRTTIARLFCENGAAKARGRWAKWRDANPQRSAEVVQRARLRQQARREAEETGRDVLDIYTEWDVLSERDFKRKKGRKRPT